MKGLFKIRICDTTTKQLRSVEVPDAYNFRAAKNEEITDKIEYLDFSNSNVGLIEDVLRVCEWIAKHYTYSKTEYYEADINIDIISDNIDTDDLDTIYSLVDSICDMYLGEKQIQEGSKLISKAYENIDRQIGLTQ